MSIPRWLMILAVSLLRIMSHVVTLLYSYRERFIALERDQRILLAMILALQREQARMSQTNTSGHTGREPGAVAPLDFTMGVNLTVAAGTYAAVYQGLGNKVFPPDGTEAAENAFQGLLKPGTYLLNDSVKVYPPGAMLDPLAVPIVGELYAKGDGSGALVATLALAVPVNSWSQKVAKSSTAAVIVEDGQVEQREV